MHVTTRDRGSPSPTKETGDELSCFWLLSSLELSDTTIYEPQIRALPGTGDEPRRTVYEARRHGARGMHQSRCHTGSQLKNTCFAEMASGSEADSYLRLADFCITQLQA